MTAGLVSYKLCDRDFDCERCPLDAALRGEPLAVPGAPPIDAPRVAALCFPDDRLYGSGHTWVRQEAGSDLRIGLDAFAVALIGSARRIEPRAACGPGRAEDDCLDEGAPLCDLDLGIGRLAISSPVHGVPRRWNEALASDGALLVSAPYDDGWIVEMTPAGTGSLRTLRSAAAARDRARLDLRRFRRRAALFLFDQTDAVGPTLQDGGEVLTDLRYILGPDRFVELIGDLVR
jgi:glycine cleavage system H lipoate-binding protein